MKLRDSIIEEINNHKFSVYNKTCNDMLMLSLKGDTNIDIIKSLLHHYNSALSAKESINWVLFTKPKINKKEDLAKIITFEVAGKILTRMKFIETSPIERAWVKMFENMIYGKKLSVQCNYETCNILNGVTDGLINIRASVEYLKELKVGTDLFNVDNMILTDIIDSLAN